MRRYLVIGLLLVLFIAACGASDQVWHEPFDAVGTWQLSSDAAADVAIAEGQLTIHVFEPGQIAWASAGRAFGDFTLTVQTTQVSGPADNEYGVLVRMQEDAQFYAFSISGDGYVRAAAYDEASGWQVLGQDWFLSEGVNSGANTNILEVEARSTHYVFRVNKQEVLRVETGAMENSPLKKGDIGLYAGAFSEADVWIAFDALVVKPLPESDS